MKYRVIIPKELYEVFEFMQDGELGLAAINIALKDFEHKVVFAWHLSLMLHFDDVQENGLPWEEGHYKIEEFEEKLGKKLNPNAKKPNAIFLGRITWNKTAELIWRVYDAKEADTVLKKVLNETSYSFPFDYRIDPDGKWELAKWHLSD